MKKTQYITGDNKKFEDLDSALDYVNRVFKETGIVLSVVVK